VFAGIDLNGALSPRTRMKPSPATASSCLSLKSSEGKFILRKVAIAIPGRVRKYSGQASEPGAVQTPAGNVHTRVDSDPSTFRPVEWLPGSFSKMSQIRSSEVGDVKQFY